MDWTRFEVIVAPELLESLSDFFISEGSGGVVVEEKDAGKVAVIAYFREDRRTIVASALDRYLSGLVDFFPCASRPTVSVTRMPDENWAIAWKDHFKPVLIGKRFLVSPPWLTPDPGGRQLIVIDPAEAFGTGTHETTQSCMVLLEKAVDRLLLNTGTWTMLDVGCGSGILAFAGRQLGASTILAVDNDPKAVASARHNATLNRIEEGIEFACVAIDSVKVRADVVTSNLDTSTLTTYGSLLADLALQCLIISGVSAEMWNSVRQTFEQQGLILGDEMASGEWGSGLFLV